MRKRYKKELKKFFCEKVKEFRVSNNKTQAQIAEVLVMDTTNYNHLERGKSCCSALTLSLFLIYICSDPMQFLAELKETFENTSK